MTRKRAVSKTSARRRRRAKEMGALPKPPVPLRVRIAVRRGRQPDDSAFTCEVVLGKKLLPLEDHGDRLVGIVDLNVLAQEAGMTHLRSKLPEFTARLREFLRIDDDYEMCSLLEELLLVMWLSGRESCLSS